MVAGYVIMRVALVFLWWQVSRHDPERRRTARARTCRRSATAQVGWVVLAIVGLPVGAAFVAFTVLILSSSRGRSSPSAGRARRGTRTTSPSATGCS